MIIVDASTLANALIDDGPVGQRSRAELALRRRIPQLLDDLGVARG